MSALKKKCQAIRESAEKNRSAVTEVLNQQGQKMDKTIERLRRLAEEIRQKKAQHA